MKCNLGICLEHRKEHLEGLGSIKATLSAGGSRSLPGVVLHPKLSPIPCSLLSHPPKWLFLIHPEGSVILFIMDYQKGLKLLAPMQM